MGSYLSAKFGYGLVLPTGVDDEFFPPEESLEWFMQYLDSREEPWTDTDTGKTYYTFDWYEVFSALDKEFPVMVESSYLHDYEAGSVALVKSTRQSVDWIGQVDTNIYPTFEEIEALQVIAKRFDIPFEPAWLVSVSYG